MPGPPQEASGFSGPKRPGECPRKSGCPRECLGECLGGPPGPALRSVQKVSESVPGVSRRCPDTPGTLSGHLLDTPERGAQRAPETLPQTLPRTPRFSGTLFGTLRARRARSLLWGAGHVSRLISRGLREASHQTPLRRQFFSRLA